MSCVLIMNETCAVKNSSFKIPVIGIPKERLAGGALKCFFWHDTKYIMTFTIDL